MIARSLGPSVVKLSLDPNGNHVVQRALQHMPAPRNDFVLEAITASLVQVIRHDAYVVVLKPHSTAVPCGFAFGCVNVIGLVYWYSR